MNKAQKEWLDDQVKLSNYELEHRTGDQHNPERVRALTKWSTLFWVRGTLEHLERVVDEK